MSKCGSGRILLALMALCPALDTRAQDHSEGKSSLAGLVEELRSEYGPVRFHRKEELEDRFIVRGTPAVLALRPRIYEVQEDPFSQSSKRVDGRIPAGLPTMYIATSKDGSKVYRLAGFEGAEESFNRLTKEGPEQRIQTREDALARGLLCAEVVYALSPKWWVGHASGAKLQAAQHFFDEGHKDGLLLGERWWKSAKGNREALQITTIRAGGGFSVSLPVFWAPLEGPSVAEVRLYSIEVSEAGSCRTADPTVILR